MIRAEGLTREFTSTVRDPGVRAALRSVVRRRYRTITAIRDVDLHVEGGTVLGLLGPNGSGKTTTLKCIAGLLTPTAGTVDVLGFTPARREPAFLRRIGFIMGQRWQLHPDLPVLESFELHRVIYDLDRTAFLATRNQLIELLDLHEIVGQPARKLSLGQRMRCEFVAALLHQPSVVLLDEPTLGLDFDAQQVIRAFVADYVRTTGAAVILTSHYLADIEALCHRVMTISGGRITFDGSLTDLQGLAGDRKRLRARLLRAVDAATFAGIGTIVEHTPAELVLEVPRGHTGEAVGALELLEDVSDVSLTDPPLEETLQDLYRIER